MNTFIKALVRLGAAISGLSLISGFTRWPEAMFIYNFVMLAIWVHAEWDWRRK
ncbi:hypothetical protein [Serratia rubidaea]|uniref:Uncharacterized protein n=1 Tax=Serratia rubidaea TaxID=61652 RepID=A0A447QTX9_SERRU|nr:hypothetical protein [Serratia rubidaea]WBF44428.1 hypothetical protein OLD77_17545 [Serratia rubidaea]VEA73421.1 Uncharacterised protein [Serratia rubidaea]